MRARNILFGARSTSFLVIAFHQDLAYRRGSPHNRIHGKPLFSYSNKRSPLSNGKTTKNRRNKTYFLRAAAFLGGEATTAADAAEEELELEELEEAAEADGAGALLSFASAADGAGELLSSSVSSSLTICIAGSNNASFRAAGHERSAATDVDSGKQTSEREKQMEEAKKSHTGQTGVSFRFSAFGTASYGFPLVCSREVIRDFILHRLIAVVGCLLLFCSSLCLTNSRAQVVEPTRLRTQHNSTTAQQHGTA